MQTGVAVCHLEPRCKLKMRQGDAGLSSGFAFKEES